MSFENSSGEPFGTGKLGKLLAGVLVGMGLGTLLPPDPVALPVVGSVSGLLVGGVGLALGTGLFLRAQRSSGGCGCSDDCGC